MVNPNRQKRGATARLMDDTSRVAHGMPMVSPSLLIQPHLSFITITSSLLFSPFSFAPPFHLSSGSTTSNPQSKLSDEAIMSKGDKNPGILNLNAPLLSTRRPLFCFRHRLSTSSRPLSPQERIPFSWERAPGLPKSADIDFSAPPPSHHYSDDGDHGYYCCYDNLASGQDSLSTSNVNAADVFSLSEAIDVLEKAEGPAAQELDSNLTALKMTAESAEDSSPSFLINRFLPDANALAASSALRYYSRNWNNKTTRHRRHGSYSSGYTGTRDEIESEGEAEERSSGRRNRKACGMERVLQWRVKPRLCGDSRSPALPPTSILGNRRSPS